MTELERLDELSAKASSYASASAWAAYRDALENFYHSPEFKTMQENNARYEWLKDAAGREYEELLSAQMCGQLDATIDAARKEVK